MTAQENAARCPRRHHATTKIKGPVRCTFCGADGSRRGVFRFAVVVARAFPAECLRSGRIAAPAEVVPPNLADGSSRSSPFVSVAFLQPGPSGPRRLFVRTGSICECMRRRQIFSQARSPVGAPPPSPGRRSPRPRSLVPAA